MGQIVICSCKGCGYQARLFTGAGMAAKNLSIMGQLFPEKIFSEFSSALEGGRVTGYKTENIAALCSECKRLMTVPRLSYTLSGGEEAVFTDTCPRCGSILTAAEDTGNLSCPRCGGILTSEPAGHWD